MVSVPSGMSHFRADTRECVGITNPSIAFDLAGAGEDSAATGLVRDHFLSRRAGPARRCMVAYVLSHGV